MIFTSGTRRWVVLTKKYAIKIPRWASWLSFVLGIMENLHERYWWCADGHQVSEWIYPQLAEIYWADRFGFIVIMERLTPVLDEIQFQNDLIEFQKWSKGMPDMADDKMENFGYRGKQLAMLDYGYGGIRSTYLGSKNYGKRPN